MFGKRLLVAALACLGFGGNQIKPAPISSTPEAYSGGIGAGFMRSNGHTPYDWGISRQCARMRRKNRMRKLGIKGSRI